MLGDACVRDVELENPRDTILSHVVRLKLTYDGVASNAPLSLFLKTARSDRLNPSWVAGRQELPSTPKSPLICRQVLLHAVSMPIGTPKQMSGIFCWKTWPRPTRLPRS